MALMAQMAHMARVCCLRLPPACPQLPALVSRAAHAEAPGDGRDPSAGFLRQKVAYTHNNPVAKHWRLVEDRADYVYSSACFYDRGEPPVIAVDDVREWMV